MLGDAFKMSYAIKPGVSGTVTLETTRPLSADDLLRTFQSVLELNGATLAKSGKLVTIIPVAGAVRQVVTSNWHP